MSSKPTLERNYRPARVKQQYRMVAWFYDTWGKLTEDRAVNQLLGMAEVADGSRILEVAVGTGRLFTKLAALNPAGQLEGIDLSPDMLKRARHRLEDGAFEASWRLGEGDAYQLPFEDGSFDYLFNTYLLDLLPADDFPRILQEFNRVLKPRGTLAIANFSEGTRKANALWYWLARYAPALLTDCRPVDIDPALRAAGFEILQRADISQNTFPSTIALAQKRS